MPFFEKLFSIMLCLKAQDKLLAENVVSFYLQFMNNVITQNVPSQQLMFTQFLANSAIELPKFDSFYEGLLGDAKLRKFVLMYLTNMVLENPDLAQVAAIIRNEKYRHLLQRVFILFISEQAKCGGEEGKPDSGGLYKFEQLSQADQATFWVLKLVSTLFAKQVPDLSVLAYLFELVQEGSAKKGQYSICFYQFFFHLFQKLIEDKVICSLIRDMVPKSMDIRCQYINKKDYSFQMTLADFNYLAQVFSQRLTSFNLFLTQHHAQIFAQSADLDIDAGLKEEVNATFAEVFELLKIFCLVSFLGGYNSPIQQLF